MADLKRGRGVVSSEEQRGRGRKRERERERKGKGKCIESDPHFL